MKALYRIRKNRSHCVFICIFTALLYVLAAVCIIKTRQNMYLIAFLPGLLPMTALLLYYETWQITAAADTISKRVFFLDFGSYSYHMIKDAYIARTPKHSQYAVLSFVNGKRFSFGLDDENAGSALKRISSHHSLRVLQ